MLYPSPLGTCAASDRVLIARSRPLRRPFLLLTGMRLARVVIVAIFQLSLAAARRESIDFSALLRQPVWVCFEILDTRIKVLQKRWCEEHRTSRGTLRVLNFENRVYYQSAAMSALPPMRCLSRT